jgi:hypothetical protein
MGARIRNLDDFLTLLKGVKKITNGSYMALCPGHYDTKPSLSAKEVTSKILVKCFAGCELTEILKPLELDPKDLFLNNHDVKLEHREIEAIYHYIDANGKPFEVVRTRPKGFYQRQPDGKGGYINNLIGLIPSLYHQDELRQAIDDSTAIYIVEGEKDVDRLRSLGVVATTNPMGAGKWRDNYSEVLRDADLIIIPDNDKPGREHGNHIAQSCYAIAKRIRILELTGESKDVSDWLDNGCDIQQLSQLTGTCPAYEPSDNGVRLRCIADVKAEKVNWLWQPYIPKGKLTLEEGDPGIGKSWISLAIATAVTLGKGLPGQESVEPANVLLASAEDGLGDTIRPRLDAMGADISRIFAIEGALTLDETGLARLESYLERVRPSLLIIDPLVAYLGAGVDIHRANETRAVMAQLARLAEKYDSAILAVRHLTKGGMSKAIYRGLGSIDFTAACRSVLLAGCDPDNPQNRGVVHIKSNLAPAGDAIGYELRDGSFYWTEYSDLTAARILATDSGDRISEFDEAVTFLKGELAEGPILAKGVYRDAEGVGISMRTLERAKTKLQAKSRKIGDAWFWHLPELTSSTSPRLPYREFGDVENTEIKKTVVTEGLGDLEHIEDTLSMPIDKAIELWHSEGAPVIHLGMGENCSDLRTLLSDSNVKCEHLEAVRQWLDKVLAQKNEAKNDKLR